MTLGLCLRPNHLYNSHEIWICISAYLVTLWKSFMSNDYRKSVMIHVFPQAVLANLKKCKDKLMYRYCLSHWKLSLSLDLYFKHKYKSNTKHLLSMNKEHITLAIFYTLSVSKDWKIPSPHVKKVVWKYYAKNKRASPDQKHQKMHNFFTSSNFHSSSKIVNIWQDARSPHVFEAWF